MSNPNFTFKYATTSRGLTASGEGSTEFYHPLLPVTLLPASGFLLILNGWNLNRCMSDLATTDDIRMLQMRAPREAITPLLSWQGSGRVFRPGAKYRYRYKNSKTGECSGLSPIPDALDIGCESPPGSGTYLGQTAYFYLPTASAPPGADTMDLFANTTKTDGAWYLADSQPMGSASYVLLTDDNTDDELFAKLAVITGVPSAIPAGWTWGEGIMDPRARAWRHPAGRVGYFGLRRFGQYGPSSAVCAGAQASDLITVSGASASLVIEPGRVGQRLLLYPSYPTLIRDPTVYRIVQVVDATTFRIYPEIQISTELIAAQTFSNYKFAIQDDRDGRYTYWSEPGRPWLIDPLKTTAAGDDYDDGTMAWFSMSSGEVFMQTRRRIYRAINSDQEDPTRVMLFQPVAEEGLPGFEAGCETPFGWVFVHETRGPRIFDGQTCKPLTADPDPYREFRALTQFQNFEPSMMEDVKCLYDPENRVVVVSYVPTGGSTNREVLIFNTSERVWRGPYRERIQSCGKLRTGGTTDVVVFADDCGNLLLRESQVLDVTPSVTGEDGTGTITSVQTKRVFTDSAGVFNNDSDERLRGSPIWFYDGTYYYHARIVDVLSGTQLELDGPPTREDGTLATLTTAWTYTIGAIRWVLITAYLDGNEDPAAPINFHKLNVRTKRGASSESFEVGASENAIGTYSGERQSATVATAPTRDVNGKVHGEMRLQREGALCQIRVQGFAVNQQVQITKAVLIGTQHEGALPADTL